VLKALSDGKKGKGEKEEQIDAPYLSEVSVIDEKGWKESSFPSQRKEHYFLIGSKGGGEKGRWRAFFRVHGLRIKGRRKKKKKRRRLSHWESLEQDKGGKGKRGGRGRVFFLRFR